MGKKGKCTISLDLSNTTAETKDIVQEHSGFVSWPALVLLFTSVPLWGLNVYLTLTGTVPLVLGFFVTILLGYISFTPLHEAVHGNISGKRNDHWLDTVCGWLAGLPFWAPYSSFVLVHLTHHSHTNDDVKDPDYWVYSKNKFFVLLRCLTIYPNYLRHIFWVIPKHRSNLRRIQLEMIVYLSLLVALIVFAFQNNVGWELLLVWIIPGFCTHMILSFTLDFLTHFPHNERDRFRQTRLITAPGLKIFLIGQDLHIIHHLYPSIPFYRYGKAFKKLKPYLEKKHYRRAKLF